MDNKKYEFMLQQWNAAQSYHHKCMNKSNHVFSMYHFTIYIQCYCSFLIRCGIALCELYRNCDKTLFEEINLQGINEWMTSICVMFMNYLMRCCSISLIWWLRSLIDVITFSHYSTAIVLDCMYNCRKEISKHKQY